MREIETPMEGMINDRLEQMRKGLSTIELVHQKRIENGGVYFQDEVRDGEKHSIRVDEQYENMLKGADMGVRQEVADAGVLFELEK